MRDDVRSVFLSDVHLGHRFARADRLLVFLKALKDRRPRRLYIVGDFIDGWKLRRGWHWDDACNRVVRRILGLVKRGTEVVYLPGNHDAFWRGWLDALEDLALGSIHVRNEVVHERPDGSRFLVLHGDGFDASVRYLARFAWWLRPLGDAGYALMLRLNGLVGWARRRLGLRHWSLSRAIKERVPRASLYIGRFEAILADYARERGFAGVVCGHIHAPADKTIGGVRYLNTGDWMETCSALLEYEDGTFALYLDDPTAPEAEMEVEAAPAADGRA
jgi:UDP-2,3-diacylglucosamine pyrophosphatase LpxH